jgi:AbrB family looped-hinge helix DNA binding protein
MEIAATITSKGQLTLPVAVREALGVRQGDRVVFRLLGDRAVVARTPSLLDLAGSVPVPIELRGASWSEIRRRSRTGLDRKG